MKVMYEELVKWLREKAGAFDYDGRPDIACDYEQAADAIEKLQEDNAALNGTVTNLIEQIKDLGKPKWILVTERLPSEELAFYLCYTDAGIVVECLWTNNKYGLGPFGDWGWRLMDVPQYQKVTHWMPLPQAPKEETE